ncbi:MAG TPA: glycosyltransferase family A protein [Gaiellaceae bacterium]|nr:glycosyltransferase family A protein [Gaiellaceae bacterium]
MDNVSSDVSGSPVAYSDDTRLAATRRSSDDPLVAVGIPIRHARHLEAALDSLLSQTYDPVRLVVLDDSSDDGAESTARRYAESGLVSYLRSDQRLGLTGAWRLAFETSVQSCPSIRYFAWGSDHDVWHPDWIAELLGALENDPDAVLAYPEVERLTPAGTIAPRVGHRLDTRAVPDPVARLRATSRGVRAGDMVYGLFRVDALERAGGFPETLLPDRLLLARLALEGSFVQVERVLWSRRTFDDVNPSLARQRRSLFPAAARTRGRLPWWMQHLVWFHGSLAGRPSGDRLRLTALYLLAATRAVNRQRWTSRRRRFRADERVRRFRRWRKDQRGRAGRAYRRLPRVLTRPLEPIVKALRRGD